MGAIALIGLAQKAGGSQAEDGPWNVDQQSKIELCRCEDVLTLRPESAPAILLGKSKEEEKNEPVSNPVPNERTTVSNRGDALRVATVQADEPKDGDSVPQQSQPTRLSEQEVRDRLRRFTDDDYLLRVFIAQLSQESGLQTRVDNGADRGIAQINRKAHPDISNSQAFDADWSLRWFGEVMTEKTGRLGIRHALCAYNAGEGGCRNPNSKGWGYADKILSRVSRS